MNEDQINKVETLIGYLEYFLKKRNPIANEADEIVAVVKEAGEWIKEEKENQHSQQQLIESLESELGKYKCGEHKKLKALIQSKKNQL